MPEKQPFEHRLSDAFRRYADRAPTDVDAMALAREIADGTTMGLSRRGRWWPFRRSHQAQGRSNTMFMTVSATGVVAILALAGALAVPALVADEESSPAGAETPLVTSGWAFFEGTFAETDWCDVEASVTESSAACLTRVSPTEYDFDVEGLQHSFGHGYSGETVIASDPRISGSWDVRENTYMDPLTGAAIWNQTVTIVNDGGSWTCQLTGVRMSKKSDSTDSGWCDGSGEHAGLRAYVSLTNQDGPDVVGYLTSGDGPPPAAPATD